MCVRCKINKAAEHSALCDQCTRDLIYKTEIEKQAANAQLKNELQAQRILMPHRPPRKRTEWKEAV